MIAAIGIDIVEVARIERAMARKGFARRILTAKELERPVTAQYLAGRWAAKEAVMKCIPEVVSWHQVEVVGGAEGRLVCELSGLAAQQGIRVLVSISHEQSLAAAIAVVETT